MANTRLEAKIAKRRAMEQGSKLNLRNRWYYVAITSESIQLIEQKEHLGDVLKSVFEIEPCIFKIGSQSIYLLSEPLSNEYLQPTVIYAGNNFYGQVYIVSADGSPTKETIDGLPFTSVIAAVDALWFPRQIANKVEIVVN